MQVEELLPDHINDEIYRTLEHLYLRLNEIVRKAEDVLDLSQSVSFQATLKRLNTASKGENYQKIPKNYFPPPSDQESFERKFKLLRRCGHILSDTMLKVRTSLVELHDATRKQKQDIVKMKKDEYTIKHEKPFSINQQQKNGTQQLKAPQTILLDEDDDIIILPKIEYVIEQPQMLSISIASDPVYYISCTCLLQNTLQQQIPEELKVCIAIESLQYYDKFYLNSNIIQECKTANRILLQLNGDSNCITKNCIFYEKVYLNMIKQPIIQLNFAKIQRGEQYYFPLFSDITDLFNEQTLFLYGIYQFSRLIGRATCQKVGNIKYLINLLHIQSTSGLVINAFSPSLDKSQFLIDFLTAMIHLNGKEIVIGLNKLTFPECQRNPRIVLVRYTHKLSQQDKELLQQNLNDGVDGGCRINDSSCKLKRIIIIFSKEKIFIPEISRNLKHWEIPIDFLRQQCETYHYQYLIHYIDQIVKCKIQDRLPKFFTVLITLINQKTNNNNVKEFDQQIIRDFDYFIKNRNYVNYFSLKTYHKITQIENYLQESLKSQKLFSYCKDIIRLLGVEEE
ncbi:unnamed protein product [Paramecium pentaurelia]|uniref:Uncharacterized protein n=1 Tax=Paramecium pentaurelia TaxID=43138 RepID=A0A8S1WLW4_9CILI|nr:unnamed protein product [Paramecium pentaurelia]